MRLLGARREQPVECGGGPVCPVLSLGVALEDVPAFLVDGRIHAVRSLALEDLADLVPGAVAVCLVDSGTPAVPGVLVLLSAEVCVVELVRGLLPVLVRVVLETGGLRYGLEVVGNLLPVDNLVQGDRAILTLPLPVGPEQLRVVGEDFPVGIPFRLGPVLDEPVELFLRKRLV